MSVESCGCVNEIDFESGILRCVSKCESHKTQAGRGGLAYHYELGALADTGRYEREFVVALGEMGHGMSLWSNVKNRRALEVGAGVGTYCTWLTRMEYFYIALEPDQEAADWVEYNRRVPVVRSGFEDTIESPYDLILCAHALEHFQESPKMVAKMRRMIYPGGRLLLIVPDDTDRCNPDHLWFYTEPGLRRVLEAAGFVNVRTCVKKVIERENFIYASAFVPENT